MKQFHEFLLENGFDFKYQVDGTHYYYTKVVEGMEFIYMLVAPHSGTKNRYMLRAEIMENFDKWSNATFQRFYKDFNDFKTNWGKYLIFDEDDEMCN